METLFAITRQPLFWLAVGLLAGYLFTRSSTNRSDRARTRYANWIKRHYPAVILTLVAILAVVALTFYLVEIGLSVRVLVDRLREAARDPWTSTSELQSLASAVAILVGVLAAAATILYSSIRVWINERTATATEEGLITDRINKAVQGLGAEKVINYRGRFILWKSNEDQNEFRDGFLQRWGEGPDIKHRLPHWFDGLTEAQMDEHLTFGEWTDVSETVPNLEVRIGSIYALERIAQDSDRDHVQIMEILCAYIRQNAPDTLAEPFPEDWRNTFEAEGFDMKSMPSTSEVRIWASKLKKPREDIQVALTVLGRRTARQIALEGHKNAQGEWQGYRLDLRSTCLQNAYMSEGSFNNARFNHTRMHGANLSEAQMQGAYLSKAQMQGAVLWEAQMQGAVLWEAQMDASTDLSAATLRGAALRSVDYSDVSISQDQIESLFGDQTVILPKGLTRPDWPEIDEDDMKTFRDKWRAWQKSIGFDPEDASTW